LVAAWTSSPESGHVQCNSACPLCAKSCLRAHSVTCWLVSRNPKIAQAPHPEGSCMSGYGISTHGIIDEALRKFHADDSSLRWPRLAWRQAYQSVRR
jgi:hypothetical protein